MITEHYPAMPVTLSTLLQEVRTGRRGLDELSPEDVERLVVFTIQREYGKTCHVEDCTGKGGPIDVIVRCRHQEGLGILREAEFSEKTTYVECKHYKRKLELDTVAKVFVVAVINKPSELIIVASSELAPQARLCADYLFAKRQSTLSHSAPLEPPRSVTGTLFHLRRLEDILKVPRAVQTAAKPTSERKTEWALVEETPFWTKAIEPAKVPLRLSHSSLYHLTLGVLPPSDSATFVGLRFDAMEGNRTHASVHCDANYDRRTKLVTAVLPVGLLAPTNSSHGLRLVAVPKWSDTCRTATERLPLFEYSLHRALPEFGDLRKSENDKFAAEFAEDSAKHVLTVHGEGGSGKTWLGNLVAVRLRQQQLAICQAVLIDETTSVEVLRTMAWGVMMPALPMPTRDVDLPGFGYCWVKASTDEALEKISEDCLTELLTLGARNSDDVDGRCNVERLAHALSLLLVRCPFPTLVVLRDCHRASFGLTQALKHLFRHLANFGWGQTRIVLEFRDDSEATLSWRQFLKANLPRYAAVVVDAALGPISPAGIAESLGPLMVGEQAVPLAQVIHQKTGGNPLLIRHLLLYFRQNGYLVPADTSNVRLRIEGFGDLEHEIGSEIEQPDDVLPVRIRKLLGKVSRTERGIVVRYLAGASFTGLQFDESLFQSGCSGSSTELKRARQILLDAEVIGQSFEQGGFEFVHELMRSAVKGVISRRADFASIGEKLLESMSRTNVLACLVGGELLIALKRPADAYAWFDEGQGRAKTNGTLLFRERCLSGARVALAAIRGVTIDLVRKQSAVGLELARTLTQTGSQIRALQVLRDSRQLLDAPASRRFLPSAERNLARIAISRQRLTLLVRMMKAEKFFSEFNGALAEQMEIGDFHYALTRFILMASHCNQPLAAWQVVPFAMHSCIMCGNANVEASLYSDIGRLYLQSAPEMACRYWAYAVRLATDRRESSHAKLNLLVGSLHGGCAVWSAQEISDLEADIQEQGVANQLCRLWNCRGILAQAAGRLAAAAEYFERALVRAQNADQPYWQWKSHNNFAVCLLKHGERERALRHLEAATSLVASFEAIADRQTEPSLRPLFSAFSRYGLVARTDRLLHQEPAAFSGLFPVAQLNYQAVVARTEAGRKEIAGCRGWNYPLASQQILWVDCGRERLALAVE